jgi:hypothetical protein
LCGVSPLLVLIVERRANAIAYQSTQHATDRGAGQTISRASTGDCRADERTGAGPNDRSGTFPRSWPWRCHRSWPCTGPPPIRSPGAAGKRKADDHDGGFRRGHIDPRRSS